MMTNVIQIAGYFPDPTTNTALSTMPNLAAPPMGSGQSLYGTYNAAAPGDTISVRFATKNADGILNCSGSSNATGGNFTYVNTFSVAVNNVNGTPTSQLMCTRENGTAYALVSGVQNLSVTYGVNTTAAGNNVDTYMNAAGVTASLNWGNVISVLIVLTFNNPLYVAGNTDQPQYLTLQRSIAIMNQVGL
jgi:type IV pilus assembly protein PilW